MNHLFQLPRPGSGLPTGYGLPDYFATAVFEQVPPGIVRETVEQYLTDGRAGRVPLGVAPLLLGPARTWKTYAACSLVRQLTMPYVKFVEVPELVYRLNSDAFSESTKQIATALPHAEFLVLDDITVIVKGTRAAEYLQYLISHRFSRGLPTLCTGNLSIPAGTPLEPTLEALYGPLVARRLVDRSEGYRVLLHL